MKKAYSIVALLLALVMALSGMGVACAEEGASNALKVYAVGDTMDDFTITLTDGTDVTLSELLKTHKAVLLNIWATWCGPCRMEFPYMEEAYKQVSDDLAIVAVSCEPTDTDEVIEQFKKDNGLTVLPMAADTIGLTEQFVYEGIPTSVMIDRNGVVCWQESGSITSVDTFMRLFTPFIADDYSESLVGFEIPKVAPNVEAPAAEDAARALLAEGGDLSVSFDTEDEYAWPWIVADEGLQSTNAGVDDSYAAVYTALTAAEGDVLSFDAKVSCEQDYDYLQVTVDDKVAKRIDGEADWTNYAVALTEGEHTVCFSFVKDEASSEGDDTAWVKNVKLATGDEAAALIAAMPVYPHAIESGMTVEVDPETAREIVFEYASDEAADMVASYFGDKFYLAESGSATLNVAIGADVNPEFAMLSNNFDGTQAALTDLEVKNDRFVMTAGVSAMDVDGYSNSTVAAFKDVTSDNTTVTAVTFFASEENVNTFLTEMVGEDEQPMVLSWSYADGTKPSTDALAEAGSDVAIPYAASYKLTFADEDGNPVEGVIANICDDTSCQPMTSDENGVVEFVSAPFAYHIQVISVPEGYEFDTSAEYYTEEAGGEMTFTLTKAAK